MKKKAESKLGINGLGRIGKLTLWYHIARKYFSEIVINVGRNVGTSLHDIAHYIERDSTYGSLQRYLLGYKGRNVISNVNEADGTLSIDGIKVTVLRLSRNPKELDWKHQGIELVVDTTGQFTDPTLSSNAPKGSARGHLEAGAKRVIVSAPFKIKDKAKSMPEDSVTTIMGINESDYDPSRHRIISGASCTTTCLAHMMKPLLDVIGAKRILTVSMATVHAATGTQEVLDRLAKTGATDLRKNRSILNNIILTTTGAATTLALVLPEINQIGFMAESVRIPTTSGSLVILVVNVQEEESRITINRDVVKDIYRVASRAPHGYLVYTDEQNVSGDIIATPAAAAIIEGHEIHTRTAEVTIDIEKVCGIRKEIVEDLKDTVVRIPMTQAVIYGWYDNEMGGYVNMLGELTVHIAES